MSAISAFSRLKFVQRLDLQDRPLRSESVAGRKCTGAPQVHINNYRLEDNSLLPVEQVPMRTENLDPHLMAMKSAHEKNMRNFAYTAQYGRSD